MNETTCDVAVIGAGMAGMAAALFAVNRNLSTLQCGNSGGLLFSSGLLDLMGVYPVADNRKWENPWKAIEFLKKENSKHPYARVTRKDIEVSFAELLAFFHQHGFDYHHGKQTNSYLPTAQGTSKPSYYVPHNMRNGASAFAEKRPCLLIDVFGLREFSAQQIVETLNPVWPGLRCARIEFPGSENRGEIHPENLAQALENESNRKQLMQRLAAQLHQESYLGLPAILGIYKSQSILHAMESELGVAVFEIPTPTVSVSGLRIKELFERYLPGRGLNRIESSRVVTVDRLEDKSFRLHVQHRNKTSRIIARSVILASGRFFGGGLKATRTEVVESVFKLPVYQPDSRKNWHCADFFSQQGHPVNLSGLEVDDFFRPVAKNRNPVYKNLFAAGSILAHQDWIREKSGSGIAVASAYSAVNSAVSYLQSLQS